MIVLGINAYHADSSAAIFVNGQMIAATEEERFRRVKHWAGYPSMAIAFCLREAGVSIQEVDYITVGRDPKAKLLRKAMFLLADPFAGFSTVRNRLYNSRQIKSLANEVALQFALDPTILKNKLIHVEHHRAHLASAFFASPFEEAAVLSIDGAGDFTTTMIATGKGNKLNIIDSVDFPVSCGTFYTSFTQFLGFPHYGDEYKVMGLAPYGKPVFLEQVMKLIKLKDNGLFDWDHRYFKSARQVVVTYNEQHIPVVGQLYSDSFVKLFGPARKQSDELEQKHKDLAASVQKATELLLIHILKHLHDRTGLTKVCIAGGVAQNSVANGKFIGATGFDELYIPSAGHDAGLSMGSALYHLHQNLSYSRQEPVYSAYTGAKFSNDEIEAYLNERGISYRKYSEDELYPIVVEQLIKPGVVGWFSGRAEFGPRALGARSILADPRNPAAKDLLNLKIKRRESFRPFAPSILEEYVSEYFEKTERVPFMEKVFPIKEDKKGLIPAVTHIDGTGRLQTVMSNVSPRYYQLIEAFRKRTGIPILLNTSFNENEPIVNSPAEALDCFLRTQMDMLVLENCVISR